MEKKRNCLEKLDQQPQVVAGQMDGQLKRIQRCTTSFFYYHNEYREFKEGIEDGSLGNSIPYSIKIKYVPQKV